MSFRLPMSDKVSVAMVNATAIIIAAYIISWGAANIPNAATFAKISKAITTGRMTAMSFCFVDKSFNCISLIGFICLVLVHTCLTVRMTPMSFCFVDKSFNCISLIGFICLVLVHTSLTFRQ
jgi:hypothetical protein